MNILNIELKGYGKARQYVCENCPCCDRQDWMSDSCRLGYWESGEYENTNGFANIDTGEVMRGHELELPDTGTWYGVYVRPQLCIDKHGL